MKLDCLYSELTLKTNAKHVLLVLDGLGDIATREQSFLTPLEAANTPNLDALSKLSAQGRMIPVDVALRTEGSGHTLQAEWIRLGRLFPALDRAGIRRYGSAVIPIWTRPGMSSASASASSSSSGSSSASLASLGIFAMTRR